MLRWPISILGVIILHLLLSMAMNISPVTRFLNSVKSFIKEPLQYRRQVILGNQACDADSMISSLCLAYLRDKYVAKVESLCYIPAAQIPRKDLVFRNEVKLLLERIEVNLEDLICTEDIDFSELKAKEQLGITLVDHNKLDGKFSVYSDVVTDILDHHIDTNQYDWINNDLRNVAFDAVAGKALVGSTCTLIAERFVDALENEPEIATLLLGVIALDTINMDAAAGIGTPRDQKMLQMLRQISPYSQDDLFETLRGAKVDPAFWRTLTVAEVMRIDYKAFNSPTMKARGIKDIGIATAMQPLADFVSKSSLRHTIEETIVAQDLSVLIVMSFVHQPSPKREMLICTKDRMLFECLQGFLLDESKHNLQYRFLSDVHALVNDIFQERLCSIAPTKDATRTDTSSTPSIPSSVDKSSNFTTTYCAAFSQKNTKASRKQVAPLLLEFFETYGAV